ncbi:hypothetical protein CXG48_15160 [Pseudomonas plecoglossicida]|uniref:hypothetical protein n=1 Tax=Pseudomonas plecoglossicida TaxID=70775 RepID=UPI000C798364|nr:hypothetical protein [Pseudomonas plecoglossicida]PLV02656.1 hypothetical protein CXG48_15160 [Pseudomonas plecoglossicida]
MALAFIFPYGTAWVDMDIGFVDLDILVPKIRNPASKRYFLDAIKAYKAGALRGSLTSLWVALAYDLIAKYREISAQGDAAAAQFIKQWDAATAADNIPKLLTLEGEILDHATDTTQVLDPIAKRHLHRLRLDRHLCAHPAFSAEAELFEPSPELVRLHLVNVIDCVLSREPRQGKAIYDIYSLDVQSAGFPTYPDQIHEYVDQRYLKRIKTQNLQNFGTVLGKSLLKGTPPEWETHQQKIAHTLMALRNRAPDAWPDICTAILRLIDNAEPASRPRAISLLAVFPAFWSQLEPATQTALVETAANFDPTNAPDYRTLAGVSVPALREGLLNVIQDMSDAHLEQVISVSPIPELWDRAVSSYGESGSFRGSEIRFRSLLAPFSGRLTSPQLDLLLATLMSNSQCWNAAATEGLLLGLLRDAEPHDLPSNQAKDSFFQEAVRKSAYSQFTNVFSFFISHGWIRPQPEVDDDPE